MSDQAPTDQPSSPNDQTMPLTDASLDAVVGGLLLDEEGSASTTCGSCFFKYTNTSEWNLHKTANPTHVQ